MYSDSNEEIEFSLCIVLFKICVDDKFVVEVEILKFGFEVVNIKIDKFIGFILNCLRFF